MINAWLFVVVDFTYYDCGWIVCYLDCLLIVIALCGFVCRGCLLTLDLLLMFD